MPKLPVNKAREIARAELPYVRLPGGSTRTVKQAITNLLAQGFRIVNPEGEDLTEGMIEQILKEAPRGYLDRS